MHVQTETVRRGRLAPDLGPAFFVAGETEAAIHLPSGCQSGLCFQPVIKRDRVAQKLGDVGVGTKLTDQTRGVPGGAGCQGGLFQKQDFLTHLRQVIGRRTTDNTAADDDDLRR